MSELHRVAFGNAFMMGCTHLEEVLLPAKVASVGDDFLANCRSLVRIDVTPLQDAKPQGARLMVGCEGLPSETKAVVAMMSASRLNR